VLLGEHESGAVCDSSRSTLELLHDRLHISSVTHKRQLYTYGLRYDKKAAQIYSKHMHMFVRDFIYN